MSVRPISMAIHGGARIADRLAQASERRFVGRATELELFRTALDAAEPPFVVLHLHGPGGIGKTTLLQQFGRIAEQSGRTPVRIDLRDVIPAVDTLRAVLAQALNSEGDSPPELAAHWPPAGLLMIDAWEPNPALDAWLREVFLPLLPAHVLLVIAGRKAPDTPWTTDVAWAPLTRSIALRNLEPDESRKYLALRGVSTSRQREIVAATYGHPLALSLAADVVMRDGNQNEFDLPRETDLVSTLLKHFVDQPPSPRHRLALHACAAVQVLTPAILAAALDELDATEMFDWLAKLACMESRAEGLVPHALAREVLCADLRQRSLEERCALNGRLLACLYRRFQQAQGLERQRVWFQIIYIQRYNPALRPYFAWNSFSALYDVPARPEDASDIIEMTRQHEGDDSALIAAHWLRRQPEAFIVLRDRSGQMQGYAATLRLEHATDEDRRADAVTMKIQEFVARQGAAREGEEIINTRFWMAREGHQMNSQLMNVVAAHVCLYWTTHPRLAWSFCTVADTAHLEPLYESLQHRRAHGSDVKVGGRSCGLFAHDWRVEPLEQWLGMKVDRASRYELDPVASAPLQPLLVLSEPDFSAAVRHALRDHAGLEELARNPLLRTRLLRGRSTAIDLQSLLAEAVDSLASPKDRKSRAALWHTYIEPEVTQEQVAERLGMPFNTYRYQLARGTKAVTQWLWRRELGAG